MKLTVFLSLSFVLASEVNGWAQAEAVPDSIQVQLEQAEKYTFEDPDRALKSAHSALTLAQTHQLAFEEGKAWQRLARIYAETGDYSAALEASHAGLRIFQALEAPREQCHSYLSLGVINRYLKLYDECIAANRRAEELALTHGYEEMLAAIYGNLGNVYFDTQDYDQALNYHRKSLEIDTFRENEPGMGNTYHNIGQIYRNRKDYARALEYFEKSLAIDLRQNNQRNIIVSYSELAGFFLETGDYQSAFRSASRGLTIARQMNFKRLEQQVLAHLPLIYALLDMPDKALEHQTLYQQLTDSLQTASLSGRIAEMQARYQSGQKDRELSLQNLRLETQRAAIIQQRILILGLVVVLSGGCLIAFLLFGRYHLRQQNLKLSLENDQYRLSQRLQFRQNLDETIHYFANSLYGKNTVEEILWDVAKNCIARLGFVDCVIYLLDEEKQVLVQKAAYGTKNPREHTILSPLVIPVGLGIVGSVARTGKPERIDDTTQDPRYLVDDEIRYSELAVPLILQEKVIGVIDSEHPDKGFFQDQHLEALLTIASLCSSKIARAQADEEAGKARLMQLEADNIKKMNAIKSHFLASISHEFRTPLQLILAPLQKQEDTLSRTERQVMERNARQLLKLVNQLLDMARADVGMLSLDLKRGNVTAFLRHITDAFRPLAENKGIHVCTDIPDQETMVVFDPEAVEKITANLLSNALSGTPAGGKVSVRARIEPGEVFQLSIADSGPGIPEDLRKRIFEARYPLTGSSDEFFEARGIGLALTRELVRLCGGTIRLESREGKGNEFTVRLPLTAAGVEHAGLPYAEMVTGLASGHWIPEPENAEFALPAGNDADNEGKPTILVVEDYPELRNYLTVQLSDHFQVVATAQGDEGLAEARKIIPDLIITDIMMPVMDGVTLTGHLKADDLTSHIPVIMLTAKDDTETRKEGFDYGAEQYLVKPFIFEELLAIINSLLTQRNRLRIKYSREVILQPAALTIPDREAEFLEKIVRIINDHITDEDFTVEELQKQIGMSRMQLHRKLKALTGQAASDFIRNIRLKRAADLLRQPGMSIAEAAYLAGFQHMSYFSKCFKEQFGILPSEFARQSG